VTFGHSGSAGNPIVLAGAPGVTLASSSTGVEMSGRRWITIRGIVVKGTDSYGIEVLFRFAHHHPERSGYRRGLSEFGRDEVLDPLRWDELVDHACYQ
jgi:hypothetical protein